MDSKFSLTTKEGQPFEVTEKGSLGLLALGYIGLNIWRQKRQQIQENKNPPDNTNPLENLPNLPK